MPCKIITCPLRQAGAWDGALLWIVLYQEDVYELEPLPSPSFPLPTFHLHT